MLARIRATFARSAFVRNVVVLLTGTVAAQAVAVAVAPVLTRLFTPAQFGVFALYAAVTALVAVFASGKYEQAVVLPEEGEEALAVVATAVGLATAVAGATALVVAVLHVARPETLAGLQPWAFLIPASVWLVAVTNVCLAWANRASRYRAMGASRFALAAGTAGAQIGLALQGLKAAGLVAGLLLGQVLALLVVARPLGELARRGRGLVEGAKRAAARYQDFPRYAAPAEAVNSLAAQLPTFLLGPLFGAAMVGHFALTQRVLGLPIDVLGRAISSVFRQRASEDYRRQGECRAIFVKTLAALVAIALPVFAALYALAPWGFVLLFGAEWAVAGEYAQTLCLMYFFKFVVSPLSVMFYVAEQQRLDLLLHVYIAASSLGMLVLGVWLRDARTILLLYAVNYAVIYAIYLAFCYRFATGWRGLAPKEATP